MRKNNGRIVGWAFFIFFVLIILTVAGWLLSPEDMKQKIASAAERQGFDFFVERQQPANAFQARPAIPTAEAPVAEGATSAQATVSDTDTSNGTNATDVAGLKPEEALRDCVDLLEKDDIIAAEQYVDENGLKFKIGDTVGIHEVLWKGLFKLNIYDEIAYNKTKISGQTALIPIYTRFGQTRRVTYLVMANRGDGWKLDHISDAERF